MLDSFSFSPKKIILLLILGLIICLISFIRYINNDSTLIVFCDVGQGDATYIRINNQIDVLIDAGPSKSVLTCLGKYMPFFDKKIEIALLSHPQKDHYMGFVYISNRYTIENFFLPPLDSPNIEFQTLLKKLKSNRTQLKYYFAPGLIRAQNSNIEFLWPTREYYTKISVNNRIPTINPDIDPNDISGVLKFMQHGSTILFTGDAPAWVLEEIQSKNKIKSLIIKMPHHGSKTSFNRQILKSINPKLAVISSGKNNRYGHPSVETIRVLEENNVKYFRTDKKGNVVLKFKEGKINIK